MASNPFNMFRDPLQSPPGHPIVTGAFPTIAASDTGVIVGMAAYAQGGGKSGSITTPSTRRSTHLISIYDILANTNIGRMAKAYTKQDPTNPETFVPGFQVGLTGGTPLQGASGRDEDVDAPDLPMMGGAAFIADGVVRCDPIVGNVSTIGNPVPNLDMWGAEWMTRTVVGGTFTDDTVGGQTAQVGGQANIMTLLDPANGGFQINDAFYLGMSGPFHMAFVQLTTPGVGTWALTWEYWDGAAWTPLPGIVDGTLDFKVTTPPTAGQGYIVQWDVPANWANSVEGPSATDAYWIRARVTTADAAPGTVPLAQAVHGNGTLIGTGVGLVMGGQPAGSAILFMNGPDTFIGDALYFRNAVGTWGGLRLDIVTSTTPRSYAVEYWNGTSWTALTLTSDTTNSFQQSGQLVWLIPGDWAQLVEGSGPSNYPAPNVFVQNGGGTPFGTGTGTGHYMRIRSLANGTLNQASRITRKGGTGTSPIYLNSTTVQGDRYTGCAAHIGDDPHGPEPSPGVRIPGVIGWGIPLPPGVKANPAGLFTFYDPIRNIHSRRFAPTFSGSLIIAPDHSYPNVTHIARWSDATQNAFLDGIVLVNTISAIVNPTNSAQVIIGNDAGAPVTYDEELADTDTLRQRSLGFWRTATVHRRRMWVAGATTTSTATAQGSQDLGNRVMWSELDNPHHFQGLPALAFFDIDPDDGDEIQAIRSLGDVLLVLKTRSAHIVTGNPQGTGQIGLQVRRVADIGCIAKKSAVVIHGRCFFLSQNGVYAIDRQGQITPVALSEPVQPLIDGLKRNLIDKSHAIYNPTEGLYILAVPGLMRQMQGCGDTGQDICDGMLVYDVQRGQWAVWIGIYAASMTVAPVDETDSEVWIGDYWGGQYRMTDNFADHINEVTASDIDFAGRGENTTGGPTNFSILGLSNALITSGRFPDAASVGANDERWIGQQVFITSGPAAGSVRRIVLSGSATPSLIFHPPLPIDIGYQQSINFEIGSVPFWMESGDLDLGAPGQEKAVRSVRTYVRKALGNRDALNFAVSPDDSLDPEGVSYYAQDGLETGTTQPAGVDLPPEAGATQRIRVQGTMAQTRPVIRSVEFDIVDTGERRA